MLLSKRHVSGMVGLVLAMATLLLVGLAAPAFAVATPTITTFAPTSGPVGCGVSIYGTNFTNGNVTAVDFNGTAAVFTIVSDNQINTAVPGAATTGPIHVTNPTGTATSSTFTVSGTCTPTITSFSPTSGPPGTGVTITGTNLLGATGVKFNTTTASYTVVSSTQITAIVPIGATTGKIHVTTPVSTADSASNFTVTAAGIPTITSFSPTSGAVGTSVTITGTNFTGATSVVFNTTAATSFTVNSATQITAAVPTGATTGPIKVTTPAGTATSSTNFTVAAAPTITSFTPTSGPVGTTVTITGTNFTGATSVKFNGVSAVFTVNSATQITATVPATATTGKITVTTPGGTATSTTNFTVTGPSHARRISLRLRDALVARGRVTVSDGFAACADSVPVRIQKRVSGHWKTVKKTTTSASGVYRTHLRNRHGRYRSLAPRVTKGTDTCGKAVSPTQRH